MAKEDFWILGSGVDQATGEADAVSRRDAAKVPVAITADTVDLGGGQWRVHVREDHKFNGVGKGGKLEAIYRQTVTKAHVRRRHNRKVPGVSRADNKAEYDATIAAADAENTIAGMRAIRDGITW